MACRPAHWLPGPLPFARIVLALFTCGWPNVTWPTAPLASARNKRRLTSSSSTYVTSRWPARSRDESGTGLAPGSRPRPSTRPPLAKICKEPIACLTWTYGHHHHRHISIPYRLVGVWAKAEKRKCEVEEAGGSSSAYNNSLQPLLQPKSRHNHPYP